MRIAPVAVPGYIAALRETKSNGDGRLRGQHKSARRPKAGRRASRHSDGEVFSDSSIANQSIGNVPDDCVGIRYATSGAKLGHLVDGSGEWADSDRKDPSVPWYGRSLLMDRRMALGEWRGQFQHQLHIGVESWIMFPMGQYGKSFSIKLPAAALTFLPIKGAPNHRLSSLEALEFLAIVRVCRHRIAQSYWGNVHRRGEFTPQELTVDCFHFHPIDFGDSPSLQVALIRIA